MRFNFDADMRSVHRRLAGKKEETLLRLSPEDWKKFNEILDRPVVVNENLQGLLTEPSAIEKAQL